LRVHQGEFLKLALMATMKGENARNSDDATEQYAEHLRRRINQQTEEARTQIDAPPGSRMRPAPRFSDTFRLRLIGPSIQTLRSSPSLPSEGKTELFFHPSANKRLVRGAARSEVIGREVL